MSNTSANLSSSESPVGKPEHKQAAGPKKERCIGRWKICETIGKGGYSFVKKGVDKKTGKIVALKFMEKADKTWAKEQHKQVVTEIECLKQIRHPNVLKLYAYNLNTKYPKENGEKIETILLVLENAPGGEIFDILYYTKSFEDVLARTYFRQAIYGLEACHLASVTHRDIKPQNLLLDHRFNLKICDFGLSKMFESDADAIMKTTYVGTRGYQAPELLLNKTYDMSCDIFSLAVVMFILLNGYPPFEEADVSDYWFAPIANKDPKKFWKLHRKCEIRKNSKCKDVLSKMLAFNPKERITISQIKAHPWFQGDVYQGKQLIHVLKQRHVKMEVLRKADGRKETELQHSTTRALFFENFEPPTYPERFIEGVDMNEAYTFVYWQDVLNIFHQVITGVFKGQPTVKDGDTLNKAEFGAQIKPFSDITNVHNSQIVEFKIKLFLSRQYCFENWSQKQQDDYKDTHQQEFENVAKNADKLDASDNFKKHTEEINKHLEKNNENFPDLEQPKEEKKEEPTKGRSNATQLIIIKLERLTGNSDDWREIRRKIFSKCTQAINGMPEWAQTQQKQYLDNINQQEQKDSYIEKDDYNLDNDQISWEITN